MIKEYKHPMSATGILSNVRRVPTYSKVLSVHFTVGKQRVKVSGKKAEAVLGWTIGAMVEVTGWKLSPDAPEMYAMHGRVITNLTWVSSSDNSGTTHDSKQQDSQERLEHYQQDELILECRAGSELK